jgi:hypothetical protein
MLSEIIEVGTGVQVWWKNNTPISSWNLGILSLKNETLSMSYFVRTNLKDGYGTDETWYCFWFFWNRMDHEPRIPALE